MVPGGVGIHISQLKAVNPAGAVAVDKDFLVAKRMWVTTTTLTKFSILLFLVSVFTKRGVRWAASVLAVLSGSFWLAYVLEAFLLCRPLAYAWDKTIPGGRCGSVYADLLGIPIMNLILDFLITILPMPSLWALQMPRKTKVQLSGVLGLGIGCVYFSSSCSSIICDPSEIGASEALTFVHSICAMNFARMAYLSHANLEDFTYVILVVSLFANLEVYIGIIIACLPTLGPIVRTDKAKQQPSPLQSCLSRSLHCWRPRKAARKEICCVKNPTNGPKERPYVSLEDGSLPLTNLSCWVAEPVHPGPGSSSEACNLKVLGLESFSGTIMGDEHHHTARRP